MEKDSVTKDGLDIIQKAIEKMTKPSLHLI